MPHFANSSRRRTQLRTWCFVFGKVLAWAFVWGALAAAVLGVSLWLDAMGMVGGQHHSGTVFRWVGLGLLVIGATRHGVHVARQNEAEDPIRETTTMTAATTNTAPIVGVTVINFQAGGLKNGQYHFDACADAIAVKRDYCDLVVLCEAREYAWRGGEGKYAFTNALARASSRPLVCELGVSDRAEAGPMLIYDPTVLGVITCHGYGTPLPHEDRLNLCNLFLRTTGHPLGVKLKHWDYQSGERRLAEAKLTSWIAGTHYPILLAGDSNCIASGGRAEPKRDFRTQPPHKRFHKGLWRPGRNRIRADTRALDFLLGTWRAFPPARWLFGRRRGDGVGMSDLAEIAYYDYHERDALRSTINTWVDGGSGLRIDHALINPAGRHMLVPGTFHVEVRVSRKKAFSDHGILRFKLQFTERNTTCWPPLTSVTP